MIIRHLRTPATRRGFCFILALIVPIGVRAQTIEDRINALLASMTVAEKIKQLHQEGGFNTADNARLAIPGFVMADGPHGVRDGNATSFPVSIGIASTWDPGLAEQVGKAMGQEFRGKGKHQMLGPSMDLARDPRNGRLPETGGEDPYLCASITTAVVKGIQSTPVLATIKHYNGNAREIGRTTNDVTVSQRMLIEHYGMHFRSAVQEGGAFSVMNAYNLINGEKCAENRNLLTGILREQWGFPYYVVSDWASIWSSERAITAGCDVCMGSDNYQNDLPGLVSGGTVPMATLDLAVRRVLRTKILSGMLDYYPPGDPSDVNSAAHQQLCLAAARKSLVLLKNQGKILPFDKFSVNTIAVIGPSAATLPVDGGGSSYVTPYYTVTPREGIERIVGAAKVGYAKGCDINSVDTSGFAAAAALAASSDVVVYVGGLDQSQEGEGWDRATGSIELPGRQQALITRLAAVNKKLVVVLISGGVCGISGCIGNIAGLLQAFYPGQEAGNAIAEVLFGVTCPGGRLPLTWPKTDAQLPAWNDNFNDDKGCGYRWFDSTGQTPQFAFGFGLSYTTFSWTNFRVAPAIPVMGEPVSVSVDIMNTGLVDGDEVVQLYVSDPSSPVPMPVKQLRGFRRISLAPTQQRTVTISVAPEDLYYYNESLGRFDVRAGAFTLRLGPSSDNLPLAANITVLDGVKKPDLRVSQVKLVPPYPLAGDSVVFLAAVRNVGAGPSPAGVVHRVTFSVSGLPVTVSDEFTGSIPPGGMAFVCATKGIAGPENRWMPPGVGTFIVTASVNADRVIDESITENNTMEKVVQVIPRPAVNLALRCPVTVTSIESPALDGRFAVDGNTGTRWSSAHSEPQSITVDLGSIFNVNRVLLRWEAAYGRDYAILTSTNGTEFLPVVFVQGGNGGNDTIGFSATARYVRMVGISRATSYGFSLFELEVYGSPLASIDPPGSLPSRFALHENYPNPFNPSTIIGFDVPRASRVAVAVYDILGRQVAALIDGQILAGGHRVEWNAAGMASGVYFCRMTAEGFTQTRKLVLQK
jgi:beta-glucosidase